MTTHSPTDRSSGRSTAFPARQGQRVLLLNPAVHDTRFHWARWQQPTLLLRLATHYKRAGGEVRLVDALGRSGSERLRRERVGTIDLDGITVNKWRFGISRAALDGRLRDLQRSGWQPDEIIVECFTTFWWEGAAEAITAAKGRFPGARVTLVGAYAALAPDHAKVHTLADVVVTELPDWLADLPSDLSLYDETPPFAFIALGGGGRTAQEIVAEIAAKAAGRQVRHFAFADHGLARGGGALFRSVLEGIVAKRLRLCLYAFGNIAAGELVEQPDLAQLMRRAGYVQVWFSDDRDGPGDSRADDAIVEAYTKATELCHEAGFPARADILTGTVCVGRADDDIAGRARLATLIASRVGSVNLWPYQPTPDECPWVALEDQNGKLFPLRHTNGLTYRDYLHLFGVAVALSSKYRSQTFNFLGDGLVARLFRESMAREAWNPDPLVKGTLQLPVVIRS
jgi:hypothetical protein